MTNKLLLSLLLLPSLLHAAPEQRWYQVEVIIFSNNNNDYHTSELWPIDYTLPQTEKSRELTRASASNTNPLPKAFTRLSADQLQLSGAAARIKRAKDLELVLHLGWLQPGLAEKKSVAVHIYDGLQKGSKRPEAAAEKLPRLDGTLRLILSRYLHLESDLIWRDPLSKEELELRSSLPLTTGAENSAIESAGTINQEGTEEGETALQPEQDIVPMLTHHVYRMQQSRRMRSKEIHYLDHPRFGIVAKVIPYQPE